MAGGVKRDADKDNYDCKYDDADENVHGYNFPIWSIRRSICRWAMTIPTVTRTTAMTASETKRGRVLLAAEASQPTKLISVTTMTPCHSLR